MIYRGPDFFASYDLETQETQERLRKRDNLQMGGGGGMGWARSGEKDRSSINDSILSRRIG